MVLDFLAHVRSESARFAAVMRDADPSARVSTCPDWDAADLLWHLAEVQWFWGTIVRDRVDDPEPLVEPERPASYADLQDRFATWTGELIDALAAAPDADPVWTWSADHSVGFVRRRMAQEALIHRVDAELTTGARTPLDPALSADGVLEAFEHFFDGNAPWVTRTVDGPVGRITASDTGDEWTIQIARASGTHPGNGKVYTDTPGVELGAEGEPTFTVEATAADLVSWLWNRPATGEIVLGGRSADYARLATVIEAGID